MDSDDQNVPHNDYIMNNVSNVLVYVSDMLNRTMMNQNLHVHLARLWSNKIKKNVEIKSCFSKFQMHTIQKQKQKKKLI